MADLSSYWPESLRHLNAPYDDGTSDFVVIAKTDDAPINAYKGCLKVSTALVPIDQVNDVLAAKGGIGWQVRSWGPLPVVNEGQVYDTHFWIEGRGDRKEKFQTIINAWIVHDREVVLPDNVMLMTYGLVPRHLKDSVSWDDPQGPVYDVVRGRSYVDHSRKIDRPLAQITMRRDYLEDYCSLKGCAAIAVYYEERFSIGDRAFDEILADETGKEFELPGRRLVLSKLGGGWRQETPQFSRVWGSRLILKPKSRPITEPSEPELIWADDSVPMTLDKASQHYPSAFVSDDVLCEYEARPEFVVFPESGGVSYSGWWSVGNCQRIGRNYISVELKKLYEGCPPHVIAHWHRFSVPEKVAEQDAANQGNRNIALRAKGIVHAFLELTKTLEQLGTRLGADFTQEDIGSLVAEKIRYEGWWTPAVVKPLTYVAKLSASREDFLSRGSALFQLLENLKPAPLRNLLIQIGIRREVIKDFASLKLLGTLAQLATVAVKKGYTFSEDRSSIVPLWDHEFKVVALERLFALNSLRSCASHTPSADRDTKITIALEKFGIELAAQSSGWGYAIDALYDGTDVTPVLSSAAI